MKSSKRSERRYNRFVKMLRRLKEDRQQHGEQISNIFAFKSRVGYAKEKDPLEFACACYLPLASKDRKAGRARARFADYPKACSCYMCGNPRRYGNVEPQNGLTLQERRALDSSRSQLSQLAQLDEEGE